MSNARLALALVAVLVWAVIGCAGSPAPTATQAPTPVPTPTAGATPTAAPTPTLAATAPPSPTPVPSIAPAPSAPALTETFTSEMNGISLSYPAGWSIQRASEPWTDGPFYFREPFGDFLYDPALTDHLFLVLASRPLEGQSPTTWATEQISLGGCGAGEPVTVDGAQGLISSDCDVALISADEIGYMILLYVSGDDPRVREIHNRAWFESILDTVKLSVPAVGP